MAAVESHLDLAFERELGLATISRPVAREAILDVVEMLLTGQGKEIDGASGAMVFYFNNLTKSASSALRAVERFASNHNSGGSGNWDELIENVSPPALLLRL